MDYLTKKSTIFALCVGLLILIVYLFLPNFFGKKNNTTPTQSAEIMQIKTQSSDTSVDSIKKDLDATNMNNLDAELNDIQTQITTTN